MQPPPNGRLPGVSVPLLGQREQQIKAQISAAVNQLSMQIYASAASEYLQFIGADEEHPLKPEHLRHIAVNSQLAAKAFFEGLGMARFDDSKTQSNE